jgi:hypothetical protein
MPSDSFDLIITSYSLYFFPHLVDEISRILSPNGAFIAITHSENTLHEAIDIIKHCMKEIGLEINDETILHKLFYSFSSEHGLEQLQKHFNKIEKINYNNSMIFNYNNINDCIYYIQKKRNLVYKEVFESMPEKIAETEQCVESTIIQQARQYGEMKLNKDDGVFRCFRPK